MTGCNRITWALVADFIVNWRAMADLAILLRHHIAVARRTIISTNNLKDRIGDNQKGTVIGS